jgi:diguanylate cyclase (GGDEF)-like protein
MSVEGAKMENARILIIDDDPGLRKTLTDILRVKGFETLAAGDGGEGLGLLGKNAVNLVLIDLGLPDISGLEVLERIKTEHPATEAIILTGNATLDSAIEATNRGAFSYLLKPYDMEQLMLQVRRAMEKQQAQQEIASRSTELERFNVELETLYKVTSAISRTIDLDRLLSEILGTLAETRLLPFEVKGSIFLVEDGTARRAAFRNLSEAVLEPCQTIRSGECLCGQALATGEIVVSANSQGDPRHSHCCSHGTPHGHVVLPLKAADRVVGVLTLYTRSDVEVERRTLNLLATIGNQIGIAIENARLYEETKNSSLHDPLTGLANRRFMEIQLEKSFEAAGRYGERLSVIMLDIDHFKKFNDDNGHPEGDRLLRKLSGILSREMRGSDHAFRYGGEEFLVILTQADLAASRRVAERLRKTVEEETEVTISLGVATFQENMEQKEQLVKMADEALYRAKQGGRNRVEIHRPAADSRCVGDEVGLQS